MVMGHIPFTWLPMDTDAFPAPFPTTTTTDGAAVHNSCLNSRLYAAASLVQQPAVQTAAAEAAARRRREEEEEDASIRLVHLLITCTGAIQAGDYSVAHGNLSEARAILKQIPTSTGIGRVGTHFADALAQRLFPAALPAPATPPAATTTTYAHFYDAGPYLKFAYATANRAILKAFEGCRRVHVVDLALMQGLQWPALMADLSRREGGPPELLRITGVGPSPTSGGRDELHEVGVRLAELARALQIPFTFQGVCADQLDRLCDWMIHLRRPPVVADDDDDDEAVAVNSVLQLHRLLVDPTDADAAADDLAVPVPIDTFLKLVVKLKPRVFTVVEQEADHNRPLLLERFTNALFHYATMFDSLEAMCAGSTATSSSLAAEAYLRGEIFDIICGEGSARTERHELFSGGWKERLARAGFTQVEFGVSEANMAVADLIGVTSFSGSGFSILQGSGSLALAWHGRPLYVATAWHAMGGGNAAGATKGGDSCHRGRMNGSSSKGNRGHREKVAGGITFL